MKSSGEEEQHPPPPMPPPATTPGTLQLFDVDAAAPKEPEGPAAQRYKGVVMQQNGHWGAQIYVHHSRIWLGTFKSDSAAARAYDSAATKLHRCDPHRNFPFTDVTVHEPAFQDLFSTEAVLEMIKDGSYETKLADFARMNHSGSSGDSSTAGVPPQPAPLVADGVVCREMFQKELTPSDVGKLNRLVIPKKHATRFLPPVSPDAVEELLLEFRDRASRPWVFRYCYWKSSQSYVFTKGWNRFVKEKGLRAKDVVGFYRCADREGQGRSYCMIDVVRGDGSGGGGSGGGGSAAEDVEEMEMPYGCEDEEVMSGAAMDTDDAEENKEMKLFGVWIK